MVNAEQIGGELDALLDAHTEWLVAAPNGKTFSVRRTEIDLLINGDKLLFSCLGEKGIRISRLRSFSLEDGQMVLSLSSNFGKTVESVQLVPRASAAELSANIELARLERANEIARSIAESFPEYKLLRVALNAENGRLAQIFIETQAARVQSVVLSDVTGGLSPETLVASAIELLEKLRLRRKRPPADVWIVAEKKQARNLRKLTAMLNAATRSDVKIFELTRSGDAVRVKKLRELKLSDLWREKPRKFVPPQGIETSETARNLFALSPEKTDVIFSKQGETVRFLGLPFARVRRMMEHERAWFGIERKRAALSENRWSDVRELIHELEKNRDANASNKRHEHYRLSPESWLEAILRRNIKLLDANLILSPIYNQFRTSADKIDLLALRKDGRLVIIELKTSPDREMVFQAADYWRKIELQRRLGVLAKARLFGDLEIIDKPALIYAVAPALSFHRDFEFFARRLSREIEFWRFELHENWRAEIKVIARVNYTHAVGGACQNRERWRPG